MDVPGEPRDLPTKEATHQVEWQEQTSYHSRYLRSARILLRPYQPYTLVTICLILVVKCMFEYHIAWYRFLSQWPFGSLLRAILLDIIQLVFHCTFQIFSFCPLHGHLVGNVSSTGTMVISWRHGGGLLFQFDFHRCTFWASISSMSCFPVKSLLTDAEFHSSWSPEASTVLSFFVTLC